MVLSGVHLLAKNACSVAVSEAQANGFTFEPTPVSSRVKMLRESLEAATLESRFWSPSHWWVEFTAPVTGSIVWAKALPDQVLVSYVVLKIWLLVVVTFGLEVADAAAAANVALREVSAAEIPCRSASGFSAW